MSNEQVLQKKVGELRTRIRLLLAQQWLCLGLTAAVAGSLLLVVATRLQWWTDAMDYIWALLLLGAGIGLAIGWTRQVTPLVAAQIADERGGLKERLSTAVELSRMEERGQIAEAQIADAAEHAASLKPAEVLPWRVPHALRYLGAAAAVLLAVVFLPNLPVFKSAQARADEEAIRLQGEKLKVIAKEMEKTAKEKKGDKNGEILRQISRNMRQLGKDASQNRIDKKKMMLKLGDLQKQMKDAQEKFAGGGKAEKSLEQVAADLQAAAAEKLKRGDAAGARQLQQMADSMSKKDMESAKRQLEELARKMQSGQMTADDAKAMADMLEQMAQSMEKSDLSQASQELKDAASKLKDAAQAARQLQQQMAQAKTDAERQALQQQMAQAMQQGAQQAGELTHKAGGT
jgi:hypothetical protein